MWIKYVPAVFTVGIFGLLVIGFLANPLSKPVAQSSLAITHVCDERGVCCYESNRGGLSCIATTIQVIVLPGDVQDNESQGNKPTSGEVGRGSLEARFSRELIGAFVPVH